MKISLSSTFKKITLSSISLLCLSGSFLLSNYALASNDDRPELVLNIQHNGFLEGFFKKGEYAIFFEARRGEINIETNHELDSTPYALDIRVLDSNKNTFLTQNNGAVINDDWSYTEGNSEDREAAMAMLPSAISELKEIYMDVNPDESQNTEQVKGITMDNRWEIWSLIELMRSAVENTQTKKMRDSILFNRVIANASYKYKYDVAIMRKKVITDAIAEHSALLVKYYDSKGKYAGQSYSCNHGACANSSSMSKKCGKTFTSNTFIYMKDYMCDKNTKYGIHVCNNDTKAQYLNFRNGFEDYSVCYSPMRSAPDCN